MRANSKQSEQQTDVSPPTLSEVQKAISNLRQGRASGSDELTPEVFKDVYPVFEIRLTEILAKINELDVIPVYNKGQKSSYDNH